MKNTALTDNELEERYCNFLDEAYGEVQIAGLSYSTSQALKEVDPTAFRCGLSDWESSECEPGGSLVEYKGEYYDANDYTEEGDEDA